MNITSVIILVAGLSFFFFIIHSGHRDKFKEREYQLKNVSASIANFIRMKELAESLLTKEQREEYSELLRTDIILELGMQEDQIFAHICKLRESKVSEVELEKVSSEYAALKMRVSEIKGSLQSRSSFH